LTYLFYLFYIAVDTYSYLINKKFLSKNQARFHCASILPLAAECTKSERWVGPRRV